MTVNICKRCMQNYVVSPDTDDYEHVCDSNNTVLGFEDVPKNGDWEDYTGSGTTLGNSLLQGVEDELRGSRAGIMGARKEPLTVRGARSSTTRTRQHIEFITNTEPVKADKMNLR